MQPPTKLVVDSWPIMEWAYGKEPVTSRFRQLLDRAENGDVELYLCRINLGEVVYSIKRELAPEHAKRLLADVATLPIHVVSVTDDLVDAAAELKARVRFSYADAFATALAISLRAAIVTGDTEFRCLERDGTVLLEWLGE